MPCNLYDNGGFGCGACKHFLRSTSVAIASGVLLISVQAPSDLVLENKERICICVAQPLPTGITSPQTVEVKIGSYTTNFPLLTKNGNNVHADQIRSRKLYHTTLSTDEGILMVAGCELNPTAYNFPTITVTA